jgi:6-bladed beta-propeller protein
MPPYRTRAAHRVPSGDRPGLLALGLVPAVSIALTACGSSNDAGHRAPLEIAYDTIADTVFVHTTAGQSWPGPATLVPEVVIGALDGPEEYIFGELVSLAVGPAGELFAMDRQVPALRVYNPDGSYRTTFGRDGSGPGEYKRPDGGMAVIGDRLVIRDPGNGRITVYDMSGAHIGNWLVNGTFSTSDQMPWDLAGNAYTRALTDINAAMEDWVTVLVRYDSSGVVADSLAIPKVELPKGFVEASNENSMSRFSVPFFPGQSTTFSPLGYFIHAVNTRYGIKLLREGQPHLVLGRDYESVPVSGSYAAYRKERIEKNIRRNFPGWRWNGPPIPKVMPPFDRVFAGIDGRIWVKLNQPVIEETNPDFDPSEEGSMPTRWRMPTVFDVFEPDGTYLGLVNTPDDFSEYPQPIFGPGWVVATTRDDLGVQRVVRYRIEIAAGATD